MGERRSNVFLCARSSFLGVRVLKHAGYSVVGCSIETSNTLVSPSCHPCHPLKQGARPVYIGIVSP